MTDREPVSVLLGLGTCPYCDRELVNAQGQPDPDGDCPFPHCEWNRPVTSRRDHRGWLRK